jgi:hypothetical protein
MSAFCPLPAGVNIEKSFRSRDNQPDEATIFLDVKPLNLL